MYYQEKIIDGELCFRTNPNGDWIRYSRKALTLKLTTVTEELNFIKGYYEN